MQQDQPLAPDSVTDISMAAALSASIPVTEVPSSETISDELSASDSSEDHMSPVISATDQSTITSTTSESGADFDNSSDDTPAS
ncbi:MAG: hypothetical protein GXP19_04195, partial [Gammaproteobacteria bacterium]|nr:hypothetical protein [Gammaproteobacteria bacterium]